jgi:hypothetical protein
MPTLPKPASQRRRRNVTAGERTLRTADAAFVPKLPFTVEAPTAMWWEAIWTSPMAAEWDASDIHGLYMLADLMDAYWTATNAATKAKLSTEIRLQGQRYGLAPLDRRRLLWNTEPVAVTEARTPARKAPSRSRDPRLKEVK